MKACYTWREYILGRAERLAYDVLLLDGEDRIALSILRSLEKRGVNAVVAASEKRALLSVSKYCKQKILNPYPHPRKNQSLFLKSINSLIRKTKFNTLFLTHDCTLITISKNRKEIIPFINLPLPSHESIIKAFDKSQTINLAMEKGVPIPKTFFIENMRKLKEISKKLAYPVVVKPRWSWIWHGNTAKYRRASFAKSAEELLTEYESVHRIFPFPLIQEYIPGLSQNFSIGALYSHSKPKAMCCIKVNRAFPISGGNSVFRESVELDPRMKEYACRLLKALNWHGIAEVEFKVDSRDNIPKLMEINGRFWGSLEVAIKSGIDFPYLLYRLIMDGDIPKISYYKVGVKCRWLEGDIHYLNNVFRRKFEINNPKKRDALLNFMKIYERNLNYDGFEWKDPFPFFEDMRGIKARWNFLK